MVAAEMQKFPQIARIQLAELRTGFCPLLNSHLIRFCDNVDNRCPNFDLGPYDINHFFNYSKNTKELKMINSWERPVEIAKMLDLIPPVLHDHNHTAQNNSPSLLRSPDVDDAPPGPPNPRTTCHSLWRWWRKFAAPQATLLLFYLFLLWYKMQVRYQLKTTTNASIPLEIFAYWRSVR